MREFCGVFSYAGSVGIIVLKYERNFIKDYGEKEMKKCDMCGEDEVKPLAYFFGSRICPDCWRGTRRGFKRTAPTYKPYGKKSNETKT